MSTDAEIEALEREAAEAEAKEAAAGKKGNKKKNKTANKLDERFQLTDKHDPEHIFPEELEMIKELRAEIPDLRFYSDKWIVYFLCSRRHDMPAVKELLNKYLSLRAEHGWRTRVPDITTDIHKEMREDRLMFRLPGHVDHQGRIIVTFHLARSKPHGRPLKSLLAYSMWEVDFLVETEKLSHLRNGLIWLCNLEGFSIMKNLDMSAEGRKWSNTISGTFPNRIRGAWLIRGGWMVRAILAAGKVLFPKKIAKRFQMAKESDLPDWVPKAHLLKDHGGELEAEYEKMWELHDEVTKQMEKRWKKVRKELRAEGRADELLAGEMAEKASLKSSKKQSADSLVS